MQPTDRAEEIPFLAGQLVMATAVAVGCFSALAATVLVWLRLLRWAWRDLATVAPPPLPPLPPPPRGGSGTTPRSPR